MHRLFNELHSSGNSLKTRMNHPRAIQGTKSPPVTELKMTITEKLKEALSDHKADKEINSSNPEGRMC